MAARHVGADVEHHHLDGADVTLDAFDQLGHLLLAPRIGGKTMGLAACAADVLQQRLQLVQAAAGDAGNIALTGKTPGDGTTSGIACANDQSDLLVLVHGPLR